MAGAPGVVVVGSLRVNAAWHSANWLALPHRRGTSYFLGGGVGGDMEKAKRGIPIHVKK